MGAGYVRLRIPLGPAVKLIFGVNIAIFLLQLIVAYALDFHPASTSRITGWLALTPEAATSGYLWQLGTYMWLHSTDGIMHILFNLLVLYFFGPWLEQRWGSKPFLKYYCLFGLVGGLVYLASQFLFAPFGIIRGPAVGASGAISGLICAFALYHWKQRLQFLFQIQLTGRALLALIVGIDLLRLLWGDPLAVEAHWGGMLCAALLLKPDWRSPRLWRLKLTRWRLKRRLRLEPGGKRNGDSRTLH